MVFLSKTKLHQKFPSACLGVSETVFHVHGHGNLRRRPLESISMRRRTTPQIQEPVQAGNVKSHWNQRQSGSRLFVKNSLVQVETPAMDIP